MDKTKEWLLTTKYKEFSILVASSDASFRSYYRLTKGSESYILMDSSLEHKSLLNFLDITHRLLQQNIHAPQIYQQDIERGYLILEDFGDTNLLDVLNVDNFEGLYTKAIDTIIMMQQTDVTTLPLYDAKFLHMEMELMQEWYLKQKLALVLNEQEEKLIQTTLKRVTDVVLLQPQNIFVHRDFHSRNIMLREDNTLGIIDYQDALSGSLTYDLVSLLKDCYISFNREDIERIALTFRDNKQLTVSDSEFLKWFDFTGMQRHIKVLGIFSRLSIRDKKDNYLKDIPRVLRYTIETALRYKETEEFAQFLQKVSAS